MEKNSKKTPGPSDVATAVGRTAARLLADGRKGRRPSEPEFSGIDEKHERTLRMLYAFLRPEQRLPFEVSGLVTAETLRPVLSERMNQIRKNRELADSVRSRLAKVRSREPTPNSWELGVSIQDLLPADRLALGELISWLIYDLTSELASIRTESKSMHQKAARRKHDAMYGPTLRLLEAEWGKWSSSASVPLHGGKPNIKRFTAHFDCVQRARSDLTKFLAPSGIRTHARNLCKGWTPPSL